MAIEFNCPYCTAAIRVPDEFSGKRGSCPKCATKLLVPNVAPQAADARPPQTPPAMPQQQVASVETGGLDAIPSIVTASENSSAAPSLARSLKTKRRRGKSQRMTGLVVPALCFVALMGLLSLILILRTPELKGTLPGNMARNMEVSKIKVAITDLGLTELEQDQVRLAFRSKPESYLSDQMTCRVALSGTSLAIDIEPGSGFSWYTVNPTTDAVLTGWIRQNSKSLDAIRLKRATAAGRNLCLDKVKRGSGTTARIEAGQFRDDFGLGFHVQAFGFAVEAVAGKRRSLCAHEDNNGTLYFVLPAGVKEFTLRGRSPDGGAPLFSGEYRVLVSGGTEDLPADPADATEAEPMTDETEEPMSDEPLPNSMDVTPDQSMNQMGNMSEMMSPK